MLAKGMTDYLSIPQLSECIRVDNLHVKLFYKGSPIPLIHSRLDMVEIANLQAKVCMKIFLVTFELKGKS